MQLGLLSEKRVLLEQTPAARKFREKMEKELEQQKGDQVEEEGAEGKEEGTEAADTSAAQPEKESQ